MIELKDFIINKYHLTPKQALALEGGVNTLVSASAGTGKTHTLIAKLLYGILREDYTVDNLLAITYTKAGASEMKKRLKLTLSDIYASYPEYQRRLADQIKRVETASITTIHGFCKDLINDYGYLLQEVDPAQMNLVFDEGTSASLKTKALQNTLDIFAQSSPNKMNRLVEHFVTKPTNLNQLEASILKTAQLIRHQDETKLTQKINDLYFPFASLEEIKDPQAKQVMKARILSLYDDLSLSLKLMHYQLGILPPLHAFLNHEKELLNFEQWLNSLDTQAKLSLSTLEILFEKVEKEPSTAFIKSAYLSLSTSKTKLKSFEKTHGDLEKEMVLEAYQTHYNVFKDSLFDGLNALLAYMRPLTHQALTQQNELLHNLLEVSKLYQNTLDKIKKEAQGMDFDDQIFYAQQILQNHPDVVAELKQKYKIILIDEFQDTNDVQDNIVKRFAHDLEKNVFRVGDVKQSIYGFQGAKPSLMQGLSLQTNNINNLVLNQNFRSKSGVIEDVNRHFQKAMNIYDEHVFTQKDISEIGTRLFNNEPMQKINSKPIDFKVFRFDEALYENEKQANAHQIARSIYENYLHNPNENLDEYYDLKHLEHIKETYEPSQYVVDYTSGLIQVSRPFTYKDIVVLVPTWGHLEELKKAFDHYQIPSDIVSGKGFYQSEFIKSISAWFKYILTHEKTHLIDVLHDSLRFTYDDIVKMNDISPFDLIEGLAHFDEKLAVSLRDVLQKLKYCDSVDALIEIAQFLYQHLQGFTQEDLNNFDLLIARTAQLSNTKPTISDFVAYLETITIREFMEESDKFPSAKIYSKKANVVKVMTYHASKGLEFPVVYVWPYSKNKKPFKETVMLDDAFGLVLQNQDAYGNRYQNIFFETHKYLEEKKQLEEHIRLFYVALTRAETRAHVFEVIKEGPKESNLQKLNILSYFGERQGEVQKFLNKFWLETYKPSYLSIVCMQEELYTHALKKPLAPIEKPLSLEVKENRLSLFKAKEPFKSTQRTDAFGFNPGFIYATNQGNQLHHALEQLIHYDKWDEALFQKENIDPTLYFKLFQFKKHPQTKIFFKDVENIEAEMPFIYFNEENKPVQNIIDLYLVKEDEIIILDYKTDTQMDMDKDAFSHELKRRYADQISHYHQALSIQYPHKKVKAYIYSFSLNDYVLMKE